MRRGERDGRLRWAFGLAVLLHAGALAVLAHLPLAQASSSFDAITVFGAGPAFSGSPVTIVDPPRSGSASSGSAVEIAPEPGDNGEVAPKPAPKPATPPRPKQQAHQDPVRSHAPEESVEPVAPGKPAPTPPSPVPANPTDPGGEGGEPVAVGPPSPVGAVSAPEVPGGGEAPAGPVTSGDGGDGTGLPRTGDGGGDDTQGDGRQGGDEGPAASGGQEGESDGAEGPANPGLPEVEWANPKVLRTTRPVYPRAAAENGVEGTVVMKVLVGERGEVVEAKVLRSSHDPRLDDAALTAVRQWRYEPATQDGKPRRVYTRATIRFKLR